MKRAGEIFNLTRFVCRRRRVFEQNTEREGRSVLGAASRLLTANLLQVDRVGVAGQWRSSKMDQNTHLVFVSLSPLVEKHSF